MRLLQCTGSVVLVALVAFVIPTASAETFTMATFADPALSSATPLFTLSGNQFTGGWSGFNLELLTPGLPATPDIPDARFTMTPLTATVITSEFYSLSGGEIKFFDGPTLVFDITFQSASLAPDVGFGASTFSLQGVHFNAPLESAGFNANLAFERFAFAFANDVQPPLRDDSTWTASFTSSAAVPEPASAGLLLAGALITSLRRRSA